MTLLDQYSADDIMMTLLLLTVAIDDPDPLYYYGEAVTWH